MSRWPAADSTPWYKHSNFWAQGVPVVVAALIAGFIAWFTNLQSQKATRTQLGIAEQGQYTDRYNAAITNLGDRRSLEVRLGGIYALQRLMQDSPRDQSTIVAVLCAFIRDQAPVSGKSKKAAHPPRTDIQAALVVVGLRDTTQDTPGTVVDLRRTELARADLIALHFPAANFSGADLTRADLTDVYLTPLKLTGGLLDRANLTGAILTRANLTDAHLTGAYLTGAHLTRAKFASTHLTGAYLTNADLTHTTLTGAIFPGANLTHAYWSENVPAPTGWVRDPVSGRLGRANGR